MILDVITGDLFISISEIELINVVAEHKKQRILSRPISSCNTLHYYIQRYSRIQTLLSNHSRNSSLSSKKPCYAF